MNDTRLWVLTMGFVLSACGTDAVQDATPTDEGVGEPETSSTLCDGDSPEQVRPEGWTRETHCPKVDPDYAQVFDDTVVHRLDITVSAEDYQATMSNLQTIWMCQKRALSQPLSFRSTNKSPAKSF